MNVGRALPTATAFVLTLVLALTLRNLSLSNSGSLVGIALVATFLTALLIYCLRIGAVGGGAGPWQRDAHRDKQPIRYWIGIAALALGAAFSIASVVCLTWILVT